MPDARRSLSVQLFVIRKLSSAMLWYSDLNYNSSKHSMNKSSCL